ncbi:MAG: YfhO family protein [Fidelibacterota bacterium]|nr:MAG: YfhO family protein [Candidatus Neomarinimicrobiota bacterium]
MVDLGRIDRQIIEPSRDSMRVPVLQSKAALSRYSGSDPVLDFVAADTTTFRVFPLGRLQNENRWAAQRVESIGGYHAAKLGNYDRFMQVTRFQSLGILRMLNVKYIVSQQRFRDDRFREAFVGNLYDRGSYQPAAVYELNAFLERAWFPRRVETRVTDGEIFELLRRPDYDPEETVYLLETEGGNTLQNLPETGTGRILEASWQGDHIRLEVEADEPAFLVVSEVYYPGGWQARVDQEPVPIRAVNTILRGVQVPAGQHEITMDFEPADWRWGRLISQLSLLAVVLGFIPAAIVRARKRL